MWAGLLSAVLPVVVAQVGEYLRERARKSDEAQRSTEEDARLRRTVADLEVRVAALEARGNVSAP